MVIYRFTFFQKNSIFLRFYIFKLKCNYKKELYTHNIHFEILETSYKTINTLVDLIINFSKNFKNFNLDFNKIKRLENKVKQIRKKTLIISIH